MKPNKPNNPNGDVETSKITIPIEYQELGKELALLATKYNLRSMTAKLSPNVFCEWQADIHFSWDKGRHDEDVGKFSLTSEMRAFVRMSWEEIQAAVEERWEKDR